MDSRAIGFHPAIARRSRATIHLSRSREVDDQVGDQNGGTVHCQKAGFEKPVMNDFQADVFINNYM